MDEGRAGQGASSSGKGQHVGVVGFGSNTDERVQELGSAASMVGVHRH